MTSAPYIRAVFSVRMLVALQLTAIAVVAPVTAWRFHIWAEIDERAHYANIQAVAEDGRYPRQSDPVSAQVQAITDNTFPAASPNDPRTQGLAGRTYEAVQTPLYYLLAAPPFLLPVDHRDKVFVLRAFDIALLAVALALVARLCRDLLGTRWFVGYAAVLAVVLWPGVLVRMVTVSNDVLAIPVSLLFVLLARQASARRSTRSLVAAGGVFGLAVLTKVTLLYLAPVLALAAAGALRWEAPRARRAAASAVLLPIVPLMLWAIANQIRYGHLGLAEGSPTVASLYPTDPRLAVDGVLPRLGRLLVSSLPQEFSAQYEPAGAGAVVTRALVIGLLAFGVAGAVAATRRLEPAAMAVLTLPLIAGVAGLVAQFAVGGEDHLFGRYLYAGALTFALFGAFAWVRAGRPRAAVVWAGVSSLVAAGFWVHLAATYYFVDLGHRLGLA